MHRPLSCAVLVILLAASSGVFGQSSISDLIGRPVVSVQFDLEGRDTTTPTLTSLVDVTAGKPLTQQDIRSSIEHLYRLGRYEDNIEAVGTPAGDGVAVTFRLTPRHPIIALEVTGNSGLQAGSLENLIEQRYGGVPSANSRTSVEQTARQLLDDAGYLDATVTSDLVLQHNPEGARLILNVEAGPLAHIAHVEVRGESIVTPAEIQKRTTAEPGAPYRRRDVEAGLTGIEDDLRARGYYEAETTLVSTPGAEGVDVTLIVNAGPRVELRIDPKDALPGKVDELIPLERERSADLDLLEDSKARIEAALHHEGYADAAVTFSRSLEEDGALLVVSFSIRRGPKYYVDHIDFDGATGLPAQTLQDLVDVKSGAVFDQQQYEAGLSKVLDAYYRAGYYTANAVPAIQKVPDRTTERVGWLVLLPSITEGPRGRISAIRLTFAGTHAIPETELRQVMQSRVGQPYILAQIDADRSALRTFYLDRGFRTAAVDVTPDIKNDGRDIELQVTVNEGPQILVSAITVVGNQGVSERAILEEVQLKVGQPLGAAALEATRQRLTGMEVFRRVSISTVNEGAEAHVIVSVVELPANSLAFGFGLEGGRRTRLVDGAIEDRLEFSPRGSFEVGRRNLGGRNRSVNLFSRASLKRGDVIDPALDTGGFGFAEYRVTGTYREHHAFRSETDLLLGLTSEQGVRTDFNFVRRAANGEVLRRLTPQVSLSGRYELNFTRLFDVRLQNEDDPLELAKLFPQVRLSIFSTGLAWDRRNNPLSPSRGTYVTADGEVAARAVGSEVGYVKTFWQASQFAPLDKTSRTVLAMRAELGVARGFARTVVLQDIAGLPIITETGDPLTGVVRDLPISQRFFAGGSTTVRGFELDRLGVPEIIDPRNGLSLGGNGVVVLNAELRRTIGKLFNHDFGVIAFLDGGNVFARARDIDLARIRRTAGFGARWDSPLGPLRLDFGFKLDHQENVKERGWEYHLSIGEAF